MGETKKYRVAVIGSRGYADKERVFRILNANKHQIKLIVSGGCKNSADELAHEWCKETGVPILIFYPKWHDPETGLSDKGAGFRRNWYIISQADKVLAFMKKGGTKGTQNSLDIAKQLDKPTKIVEI